MILPPSTAIISFQMPTYLFPEQMEQGGAL